MQNTTQKHLLLVRSGYPAKEFVLKELKDLGYHLIVLDNEVSCPTELVDEWIIADLSDEAACVRAVMKYLKDASHRINGAVTFWEEATLVTAKITTKLGLKGIPYASAKMLKNKFTFRSFLRREHLATPRHAHLRSMVDIAEISKKLTYPLVVKPIYGACSAYVIKVSSEKELRESYRTIKQFIKSFWLTPEWKSIELYVEEYIDGDEVDVDMLLQDGKVKFWSISDNFQTNEPYFVETGQAIPSRQPISKQKELVDMAEHVLLKAGITDGCIHFEAKYSSTGPISIEVNMRMGGDETYTFVKEAWGADLVEYAARIATGDKISVTKPKKPFRYLQSADLLPDTSGTINKLHIDDELYGKEYLKKLAISKHKGETIGVPPYDFDYLGWIGVSGKTTELAAENLKEALNFISYKITPYDSYYLQKDN